MVFVETPLFESRAARLLSEDDVSGLQTMLMLRPDAGDVIPGSGGVRKVRVPAKGKGKSGGARVIYYWVQADGQIFLLFVYAKNERANLTAREARQFREAAGL
ncbi:MAG: type II toxin-antitoxin system RelE/ParE family toxin [Opitutaceae bacterium]|nr:type II toxin-antitoxin system RelE/ParE family toxin [Opitutaceae bacterium]